MSLSPGLYLPQVSVILDSVLRPCTIGILVVVFSRTRVNEQCCELRAFSLESYSDRGFHRDPFGLSNSEHVRFTVRSQRGNKLSHGFGETGTQELVCLESASPKLGSSIRRTSKNSCVIPS
jgi:hypothetical protein